MTTLAMLLSAGSASAAIPSNFFAVPDQQGVNDVNADQNDLTQMGRDDDDPAFYKLFWSWDSTSLWTGTGQTGDACALFDADGDGRVDYAACARIRNPNADPTRATLTADSPYLFSCSDARDDRCSQPTPVLTPGVTAGTIGSVGLDRNGRSDHGHRPVRALRIGFPERCDASGQRLQARDLERGSRKRVHIPVCRQRR